jgi:hypothetical protein
MEGMTSIACHKKLEAILMENCAKAMTQTLSEHSET